MLIVGIAAFAALSNIFSFRLKSYLYPFTFVLLPLQLHMLSKSVLIKQLSGTIGKLKVLELTRILKEESFALRDLADITFYPEKDIAFRAAGILENIFLQDPANFAPDLDYLLSRIKEVKHESCQRHYVKILAHLTAPKAPSPIKEKLEKSDLEPVVEQCFDWMIAPKVKIAVKVFASETLFNLRHRYPWIAEELENQIRFLMQNGSPAIQSRGKKLLKLLTPQ